MNRFYLFLFFLLATGGIVVAQQPTIGPANVQTEGCDSLVADFIGSSDRTTISWIWSFGDGDSSFVQDPPAHTYDSPGAYTVELKVVYNNNQTDSATKDVLIHHSPEANFTDTVYFPESSFKVYLIDSSITDPAVDFYNYEFDFGDGTTQTYENQIPWSSFPHPDTYNSEGSKNVTMIISDAIGCADTLEKAINVEDNLDLNYKKEVDSTNAHAFSPNNDGQNDLFKVKSNGVDFLKMKIFSRTGAIIYENESTSIIWDGKTPSGLEASPGVYYYLLENQDVQTNEVSIEKGIIYLFR